MARPRARWSPDQPEDRSGTVETKVTLIYDNPQDAEAFEAEYPDLLVSAGKSPGLRRMETSKVWPKEDGSPSPAYRLVDLYFAGYKAARAAVITAEASEFFPRSLELATGGVRISFAGIEES